jgi:hypothetical protein
VTYPLRAERRNLWPRIRLCEIDLGVSAVERHAPIHIGARNEPSLFAAGGKKAVVDTVASC